MKSCKKGAVVIISKAMSEFTDKFDIGIVGQVEGITEGASEGKKKISVATIKVVTQKVRAAVSDLEEYSGPIHVSLD